MESLSKQELISTITKQADQMKRYESRLRDVVAAYKGLAKEKEALEISLKALNKPENAAEGVTDDSVAALMESLSTLTAEKSRMEEAFQADKKVTREKYENMLSAMREESKAMMQQYQVELSNLKAKLAYEIQERDNERADHAAMLKELHSKLNSERKTKERLEDKVEQTTEASTSQAELEKRVRDLSGSLEAAQRRLQRAEARTVETPALLVRLQNKLALVAQSHSVAIREEQIKVKRAEESARKTCARQEERVALLEGRVAELSATVGEYDARRRRDRQLIRALQDAMHGKLADIAAGPSVEPQQKSETDNDKIADSEYLQTLIDKIHILKKELIAENDKLGNPIDLTSIFKMDGYENVHSKCKEDYESLKLEFERYKAQNVKKEEVDVKSELENLKSERALLKEKLETYGMMLEDERQDKADSIKASEEIDARVPSAVTGTAPKRRKKKFEIDARVPSAVTGTAPKRRKKKLEKLKSQQEYHKEIVSDLKTRILALEKQVATHRERYSALLQETDQYIRARNERHRKASVESYREGHHLLQDVSAPPHMLHYAHELARKDLDISQLRKDKHILEGQYRDHQRDATIEKERFKEVIRTLKEEIDRLRRGHSRAGANLEYLKNVVLAYLLPASADIHGRRHMLNAIAAVLHFTADEKDTVLATL